MKKHTKISLGIFAVLFGVFALSSCTASFCSINDQANMLYAIDNGITKYTDDPTGATLLEIDGVTNIYYTTEIKEKSTIDSLQNSAKEAGIKVPSEKYWHLLDVEVLKLALGTVDYSSVTLQDVKSALENNGYLKFADSTIVEKESKKALFTNWDILNDNVRKNPNIEIDECATKDFVEAYKKSMKSSISNYRSCIAIKDGEYGYYGVNDEKIPVNIEAKSWGYAWGKGFFEGLLVYPIAWLVETFCSLLAGTGLGYATGVAQFLTILIVTFIIRGLMLLLTIKQQASTAKMQELQPELTKIQNKYPNSNTNQYEKQRMAEETSKLYKKNGINPFTSIIVLIVQFPVFICVWGALQGAASLSTGKFLGLQLSESISSVLFKGSSWTSVDGGAFAALVLFILMAGAQVVSMLLPQWIQKKNTKNIAKLGKNPAADKTQSNMKMFTYIMMVMIIIMGFSLASAMGVYWFVGALFSICQTLITNAINNKKKLKKK